MKKEQKIVAIGAGSGVLGMACLVYFLFNILPNPTGIITIEQRLAYTLGLNVLAIVPFFIMLVSVGNSRFFSDAINPLVHMESESMQVDGRVADNTLQQNFVFLIGTLALSTILSEENMKLILALVIVFIIARVIFWIGYRINPLYRAPGMAGTSYMNLGIILFVLYSLFNLF